MRNNKDLLKATFLGVGVGLLVSAFCKGVKIYKEISHQPKKNKENENWVDLSSEWDKLLDYQYDDLGCDDIECDCHQEDLSKDIIPIKDIEHNKPCIVEDCTECDNTDHKMCLKCFCRDFCPCYLELGDDEPDKKPTYKVVNIKIKK